MKMLKYVKMILVVGALGISLSGCVSSDDPDFQVGVDNAYVIQKNNEFGGKQFAFYGTVFGAYGTVASMELRKDYLPLLLKKLGENYYETNPAWMTWGPLSNCNGSYTITAMDEEGVAAQNSFTVSIEKEMGELTITEPLKYENSRLTATWKKVDNATTYGFLVGIGVKDGDTYTFSRINVIHVGAELSTNGDNVTGSLLLDNVSTISSNGIASGTELVVAVVAAITSQTGNLYLEGDYYKVAFRQDGITSITPPSGLGVY